MEEYIKTVLYIKNEIIKSRYHIAKVANQELLYLYFRVGELVSEKVAIEKWGSGTIKKLSDDLQNELKGLRGFSSSNIKKMRIFYESWKAYFDTSLFQTEISSLPTNQLKIEDAIKNSSLATNQFTEKFLTVSFTSHYEILSKVKSLDERIYYIIKSSEEFWSVETLRYKLKNNIYNNNKKKLPTNFKKNLTPKLVEKALSSFRDHYLLDFIAISDEENENERVLETEIVSNIKKFLMSLGSDFSFIANQYRLIVDGDEYFIDLLFYHRGLQSLVAFELKTGKFKPEYLGKMNFYLSALDEYVKQEHENPSIGIILCKDKKNKVVEFAFRDFNKAMGVATYETSEKLPEKYRDALPNAEELKKIL